MSPGVSWDGTWLERIWTDAVTPEGDIIDMDTYSGAANPTVGLGADYGFAWGGTIRGEAAAWLTEVTQASVANYANTSAELQLLPNVNTRTASGSTDWQCKAYFTRALAANKEAFGIGSTLFVESTHRLAVGA